MDGTTGELRPRNPLDLATAIRFGFVLAVIMVLARAAVAFAGNRGVYILSVLSGLADVDAITLSLATMAAHDHVSQLVAVVGISVSAAVNTLVKPTLVTFICSCGMGFRVPWPLLVGLSAAAIALWSQALR